MALVVDSSALVYAVTASDAEAGRLRHRLIGEDAHAPHLIDAEVGNVLRRQALRGDLAPGHASRILDSAPRLIDHRYEHHGPLMKAAWALHGNLSFYDACYAALAATLRINLVTCDKRLANAPGLPCVVEVVP